MKIIGAILFSLPLATNAFASELFHIDFEEPVHHVGHTPTTGTGSKKVSQITAGAPEVINTMAMMNGDSLEFDAVSSGEQFKLNLGTHALDYSISCDFISEGLRDSQYAFTMSLDTPQPRSFSLDGATDKFCVYQPSPAKTFLQFFEDDHRYNLKMDLNFSLNSWTIAIDGLQKYSGTIGTSDISSICFGLMPSIAGAAGSDCTKVYMDNVIVAVPEPSAWALLLLGLPLALARRRTARG